MQARCFSLAIAPFQFHFSCTFPSGRLPVSEVAECVPIVFSGITVPEEETKVNDTPNWLQESLNNKQYWATADKGDVAKCCPLSRLAVPGPQFHRQVNLPQVQMYLKMLAQGAIPTKGNKVHKDLAIACFSLFNFVLDLNCSGRVLCTGSVPTTPMEVNVTALAKDFPAGLPSAVLTLILRKVLSEARGATCLAPTEEECHEVDPAWTPARLSEAQTQVQMSIMAGVHTFKAMKQAVDLLRANASTTAAPSLTPEEIQMAKVRTLPSSMSVRGALLTLHTFSCPPSCLSLNVHSRSSL